MPTVTMFPAGNGDAFLIEHNRTLILIDGGYSSTFHSHILPRLRLLADCGKDLSLVVSTHIDADHISGLVQFLSLNGPANDPQVIPVRRVWHNSLRSLVLPPPNKRELSNADIELLQDICRRGYAPASAVPTEDTEISATQGSSLASLLRAGRFNWNEGDGAHPIAAPFHLGLDDDVTITVLGPTHERLGELRDWWIRELRRLGIAGTISRRELLDDAFEFLCSHEYDPYPPLTTTLSHGSSGHRELDAIYQPDNSTTNASSISLIIQAGPVRLLFLGDAHAEDSENALAETATSDSPITFDAVKLSHHGSFRNTSPSLLRLIDSATFLVSSNGERHNHPDPEVLRAVVDRPSTFSRNMHFNFSTTASRELEQHTSKSGTPFAVHEHSGKIEIL